MLFCKTHDLVWEIISVSEKRMENCIVKIIHNVFEKNDEGGLFPLTGVGQDQATSLSNEARLLSDFRLTVFENQSWERHTSWSGR